MEEGKAVKTSVKLGGSVGERAIITDGLSVDDQVIIRGNELLKDGSSVKLAGKPSEKPKKAHKPHPLHAVQQLKDWA